MSARLNSGASASRGASSARWTKRVRFSAESTIPRTSGSRESKSQPASDNAPPPAISLSKVSRRVRSDLGFGVLGDMLVLLDPIAAGDHRDDVVDRPGQHDHRQMHEKKRDEEAGEQEMH